MNGYRYRNTKFPIQAYVTSFVAITRREFQRFLSQRGRFLSSLVRPLIWLLVFAAGFRAALGLSIIPPYETYITYEIYIIPGLCGMIQLFNGMQSSLAMVYDREAGSMRVLLTSPMPRSWLLFSRLCASTFVSILQVYVFLAISAIFGLKMPSWGYVLVVLALFPTGLMLGALGLLLSSAIRQLENFSSVMNFVIFPTFFLSTALYPLWRMAESSSLLRDICAFNPFSDAVELIRFSLYGQANLMALFWVVLSFILFFFSAIYFYRFDGLKSR